MIALADPTWGAVLIALIVAISQAVNTMLQRKTGREAKEAVATVATETKKVADATATAATSQTELLLAKHDQVIEKVAKLSSTVERNRAQNAREHQENKAAIHALGTKLDDNSSALFGLIAEVDSKVTNQMPQRIEVDVMSVPEEAMR